MRKTKTEKTWSGHKLFGHTYKEKDIRTNEDKYQDAVLANLEKKVRKGKGSETSISDRGSERK